MNNDIANNFHLSASVARFLPSRRRTPTKAVAVAQLLAVIVLLTVSQVMGDATIVPPPMALLVDALKASDDAKTLMTSEKQTDKYGVATIVNYQKLDPDGTPLKRLERTFGQPGKLKTVVVVTNRKGETLFVGNRGRLMNIAKDEIALKRSIDPTFDQIPVDTKNKFESQTIVRDGSPSLQKITMTLSDEIYSEKLASRTAIAEAIRSRRESAAKAALRMLGLNTELPGLDPKALQPYIYIYKIDPETKVIWGTETYSKNGDLIASHDFTEVNVGIPLADDLFEVPKSVHIDKINDYKQFFAPSIN